MPDHACKPNFKGEDSGEVTTCGHCKQTWKWTGTDWRGLRNKKPTRRERKQQ